MGWKIGVDIGGTFTDVVLLNPESGRHLEHKLLTTPSDPSEAVVTGVRLVLEAAGVPPEQVECVVHGTTLVANTLIERKGARAALLVTEGFEDLIELRNEQRYDVYDLFSRFPEPLVAAGGRVPVRERILSDGTVLTPLDGAALAASLEELRGRGEPEAVAVCLIHSYANAGHEQEAGRLAARAFPGVPVSLSSEIVPHAGEYERLSTAVANAYVQPVMGRYLARLSKGLREAGCRGELYLMLSDGASTTVESARAHPVRLLESGPAAGIAAVCKLGEQAGGEHLVAFDVGGTTAKICIVDGGAPQVTWEMEAARVDRYKKGSGLPMRIPSVEMVEIGAGGGSIARIGELGLLKVGPESAGADPGPACYGRGGERPTVTDAALLLGFLDSEYFLGGRLKLDADRAWQAVQAEVAGPMGLSVEEAALGIYRISCEQMADAMRMHFAERGKDAREYTLVAFGGAGPAHACEVARALRIPRVLVPPAASLLSAGGLLMAPLAFSLLSSYPCALAEADTERVRAIFRDLSERATAVLASAGIAHGQAEETWFVDMKYAGQKRSIEVPLRQRRFGPEVAGELVEDYQRLYSVAHGRAAPGLEPFIEALKVRAAGPPGAADWLGGGASGPGPAAPGAPPGDAHRRAVRFPGSPSRADCPVLHRDRLVPGQSYRGPAIIPEEHTVTVVRPGDSFQVDARGNLIISLSRGGSSRAADPGRGD